MTKVVPDQSAAAGKKEQVENMFDKISSWYDFLNHLLSLGIDITWRRKMLKKLADQKPGFLLDVATGTADVAIMATDILKPERIIGIDISQKMLDVGQQKVEKKRLQNTIELYKADSENLPFDDDTFDAVTVAFGVRNFEDLEKGLQEMQRVMKPGGKAVILEFSHPETFPVKQGFNFYFFKILPFIGNRLSKSNNAYRYLPESVMAFPSGKEFLKVLHTVGYLNTTAEQLAFGICTIYTGDKPK